MQPTLLGLGIGKMDWDPNQVDILPLAEPPRAHFDCGADEQNRFLHERAWRDQRNGISITHLLDVDGAAAGYVALLNDRIRLGIRERPQGVTYQFVSGVKIAQLAVSTRFAGRGLGKFLVRYSVESARWVRRRIGCRYVTLDAQPHLVGWYEAQGFVRSIDEQAYRVRMAAERGRAAEGLPVSMRFDLYDAREE